MHKITSIKQYCTLYSTASKPQNCKLGACCSKTHEYHNEWFQAVKNNQYQYVQEHADKYATIYDKSNLSIKEKDLIEQTDELNILRVKSYHSMYDITIPYFSAIHYAIYYNHTQLIPLLLEKSCNQKTQVTIKLPVNFKPVVLQTHPQCININAEYPDETVVIPAFCSPLQMAIILNKFQIASQILSYITQLPKNHKITIENNQNSVSWNELMYLTKQGTTECYQLLQEFGEYLITNQYSYRNQNGDSALSIAIFNKSHQFFKYFMSLSNDGYIRQVTEQHLLANSGTNYLTYLEEQSKVSQRAKYCYLLLCYYYESKFPQAPSWIKPEKKVAQQSKDQKHKVCNSDRVLVPQKESDSVQFPTVDLGSSDDCTPSEHNQMQEQNQNIIHILTKSVHNSLQQSTNMKEKSIVQGTNIQVIDEETISACGIIDQYTTSV